MSDSFVDIHCHEDLCPSTSQELCREAMELFNCGVCSELVYKPVVQACGHIFCFWCAFQAMNIRRESQCPLCTWPYKNFPRVCGLLHFALVKAIPEEYKRRGLETQSTEEQKKVFSPRFRESPRQFWSPRSLEEGIGLPWQMVPTTPRSMLPSYAQASRDRHISTPQLAKNVTSQKNFPPLKSDTDTGSMQSILTVDDFACSFCRRLLYRPVVVNCGEVFCELCLKEVTSCRSCPSCQAPHPSGSVLLCLELHQYLESAFPTEYLKRKLQQPDESNKCPDESNKCPDLPKGDIAKAGNSKADGHCHVGVGCDGCGMYPIEGDRYRCDECTEKIGFDLCGSCYKNGGSLLGRFNQEHRPYHRMSRIESGAPHILVLNMRNSSIQRRR